MRKVHYSVRKRIFSVLDTFYPLVRSFMPLQTYHYAACGGTNTLISLVIYYLSFHYWFNESIVYVGSMAFEPHVAALGVALAVTLPIGFYLSMYVTFQGSYLRRRVQFIRYFLVISICMVINYFSLKLLVETLHWYPLLAQMATTGLVIIFNYFSQRHFSFRVQRAVAVTPSENLSSVSTHQ